jgi:hypothetical protein
MRPSGGSTISSPASRGAAARVHDFRRGHPRPAGRAARLTSTSRPRTGTPKGSLPTQLGPPAGEYPRVAHRKVSLASLCFSRATECSPGLESRRTSVGTRPRVQQCAIQRLGSDALEEMLASADSRIRQHLQPYAPDTLFSGRRRSRSNHGYAHGLE